MLVALIVLSSLATLGTLTVVSVQSSLKASTNDRSQTVALYAADSGGAMAIEFLRTHFDPVNAWGPYVGPYSDPLVLDPSNFRANDALPGDPNNPFSTDQNAYFHVEVINNHDANWGTGSGGIDTDARVFVRSTGHGPQGSLAIVEWEIERLSASPTPPPPNPPLPTTPVPMKNPFAPLNWDWAGPIASTQPVMILSWRTVL
jgi:type II secretory pathway pseudopilin PulG